MSEVHIQFSCLYNMCLPFFSCHMIHACLSVPLLYNSCIIIIFFFLFYILFVWVFVMPNVFYLSLWMPKVSCLFVCLNICKFFLAGHTFQSVCLSVFLSLILSICFIYVLYSVHLCDWLTYLSKVDLLNDITIKTRVERWHWRCTS